MAITKQQALDYHALGKPGKIEVTTTKPCLTQVDLSMAYTPGVAQPCLEIEKNPEDIYKYTAKGNLVAVISNGTAVLGLGDIGAGAGKPVMEGKGVLFKRFADVDVFDIELDTHDPDEVIKCCQLLEPTFGGINLEDIKGPECFYIEETLKATMKIPVFHDDQHGTAIISGAALLNALELVKKDISKIRVVFSGAGAAGISCAKLYCALGVKHENLLMVDSKGVMYEGREQYNRYKAEFARKTDSRTLADAMKEADVFVGVSIKDMVSKDMVRSMGRDPIIFAMANPDPEITYPDACDARKDLIMATGRSDYPNQVNNVLGFPFIFRGALDVRATAINEEMKIAATHALAALAKQDVPEEVARAYGVDHFKFGRDYIIPKPFDTRVLTWEASAVAKAAMDTGVAKLKLDIEEYKQQLNRRIGKGRVIMLSMHEKARKATTKRVVFPEGNSLRILRAAHNVVSEKIAAPIVLGEPESVKALAVANEIDIRGIEIIDPMTSSRLETYAQKYFEKRARKGVTLSRAREAMENRTNFGLMMLDMGDCDAVLSGATSEYPNTVRPALQIIGLRPGVKRVCGVFAMIQKDKVYMFADTTINVAPNAEELAEIAILAAGVARHFSIEPKVAMLSFSSFGATPHPESQKVAEATRIVKHRDPKLMVDGEIQADVAVTSEFRQKYFPFTTLTEDANTFVFPNLDAANIAYKLMHCIGGYVAVGPILVGLAKPVHVLHRTLDVTEIVDMVSVAVIDAQIREDQK